MNNEWINTKDKLPKINELVYTKSIGDCSSEWYIKSRLAKIDRSTYKFINEDYTDGKLWDIEYWKPIPEKLLDFSKLKEDDLISLTINHGGHIVNAVGYFQKIVDGKIIRYYCNITREPGVYNSREIKNITKIIRINIKDKTFEEI